MTPATDFSGVTIPFTVNDLLTSTSGILGLLSTFIVLAIAFMLAPKLIGLIKGAIGALRRA